MTDKPSRNEDEYFAKRDAELLRQQRAAAEQAQLEAERRSHHMKCPKCGYELITGDWEGVQIDQCTNCHGIWFDAGEAEGLLKRSASGGPVRGILQAVLRGISGKKRA